MNTYLSETQKPTRDDIIGNPPGILKEISDYLQLKSFGLMREHAIAAALSLVASVLGRRYCNEDGQQTNLYLLSVGPDATGKRCSMRTVEEILENSGLEFLLTGELADQEALIARVSERKNLLLQFNALSTLMTMLAIDNLDRRDIGLINNLTELFDTAASRFYLPDHGVEQDINASVDHPCVNVHIALTAEGLFVVLASSSIVERFLNRFLIVPNWASGIADKFASEIEVPESIQRWIHSVVGDHPEADVGNGATNAYTPTKVMKTQEAEVLFKQFERKIDKHRQSGKDFPWGRAREHAEKIAMIAACADNLSQPSIAEQNARWAIGFVRYCVELLDSQRAFESSHSSITGLGSHITH